MGTKHKIIEISQKPSDRTMNPQTTTVSQNDQKPTHLKTVIYAYTQTTIDKNKHYICKVQKTSAEQQS